MPVESRDDLVKRLQRRTQRCGTEHGIPVFERVPICLEAATRIASDAKWIAELEAECAATLASFAEVQAEADTLYKKLQGAERELDTANANHRDMASRLSDMGTRLETAERTLAEETERCAAIADVFADQCDATAIASPVIEQVAALRAKEQAATTIATAIRSGKTDGKE